MVRACALARVWARIPAASGSPVSKNTSDTQRLLDEAIDLIIRQQNDPTNPVPIELIEGWRARSPEHEAVWQKVSAAHGMSGEILTERAKTATRSSTKMTRRKLMLGAAGLGVAAVGSSVLPDAILEARADHVTGKGEIRRVDLSDGSVAVMGPETALALGYAPQRRGITLLRGMSYFEVAEDAARPFEVETDRLAARALGTAFDVSVDAGLVSVSVANGEVRTRARDQGTWTDWADAKLAAGHWMTFDPATRKTIRGTREAGQIAAWRRALLIADREPVSVLIARISRWCPGRVIVADPFIGEQRVSGLFDLREPWRALAAVVHPVGGRVRRVASGIAVIMPF
jgi:transmembrane sensor